MTTETMTAEPTTKTGAELTQEIKAEEFDLTAHKNKPAPEPTKWIANGDWYEDGLLKLELREAYENKGGKRICKVFARLTALDPVSAMKVKHAAFRQLLASETDEIEATKRKFAIELNILSPNWQRWEDGVKVVPLTPTQLVEQKLPRLTAELADLVAAIAEDESLKAVLPHIKTAHNRLTRAAGEMVAS